MVLADIEECADVRMGEPRDRPCLAGESPQMFGIMGRGRRQDFDGDVAIEAGIAGAIHLAHATGSELLEDAIRAE